MKFSGKLALAFGLALASVGGSITANAATVTTQFYCAPAGGGNVETISCAVVDGVPSNCHCPADLVFFTPSDATGNGGTGTFSRS